MAQIGGYYGRVSPVQARLIDTVLTLDDLINSLTAKVERRATKAAVTRLTTLLERRAAVLADLSPRRGRR